MTDGSAPMPYTEADVERVAQAMRNANTPDAWTHGPQIMPMAHFAKVALDALAAAGRLLPEGASSRHLDDLEAAWGLIANAWEGCWEEAPADWRAAAERWRDERWHKLLEERYPRSGEHQ